MGHIFGFILRVLAASLVVGLLLTWFGVDPRDVLAGSWTAMLEAPGAILDAVAWTVPYILTGAIIVVPVVAVALVLRLFRRNDAEE